jgi:magnesium-protoporphyrin IX monomethyl ester (oxidative) cyclase
MNAHSDPHADSGAEVASDIATTFDTTAMATETTLLNPRFYTTDFDAMDRVDVTPVRREWDQLIAQMKSDPNKGHFKKTEAWDKVDWEGMDAPLKREFIDFLVSSCTAEFSGCVLYKEMKRRGTNPDICELFSYMSRDEARHAGFINDALREAGVAVNLGFLTRAKKYTYFRPKFIYYATYLSEKIGYARYITIYRHLERHPEMRFHPIFKWFKEWCNDEFSHGEAFALLMRTDAKLTTSWANKMWIRFFLTAVYSTMWVRDHARVEFHKALGVDIDWYDQEVYRITSEIARQVFPVEINIDHPRWKPNLRRMNAGFIAMDAGMRQGGLKGRITKLGGMARAAFAFTLLFTMPMKKSTPPVNVRLEPVY